MSRNTGTNFSCLLGGECGEMTKLTLNTFNNRFHGWLFENNHIRCRREIHLPFYQKDDLNEERIEDS